MSLLDVVELKNRVKFLDLLKVWEKDLYKERLKDLHEFVSRITKKEEFNN